MLGFLESDEVKVIGAAIRLRQAVLLGTVAIDVCNLSSGVLY